MRFVYVAIEGEWTKVGITNDPYRRSHFVQDIVVAWHLGDAALEVERIVKRRYKTFTDKYRGREWFRLPRSVIVAAIRAAFKELGIDAKAVHRYRDRRGNLAGWPMSVACYHYKSFGLERVKYDGLAWSRPRALAYNRVKGLGPRGVSTGRKTKEQ